MNTFIKFTPYFLIIALALIMHHLCLSVSDAFFPYKIYSQDDILLLKVSSGIIGLVPSIILIIMSTAYSVKKIIQYVYLFAISATLLGFFFLLPQADQLHLPTSTIQSLSMGLLSPKNIQLVSTQWIFIVYHSLISVWSSGMIILLYGYANQRFQFNQAVALYPIFGVLAVMINIYFAPGLINQLNRVNMSLTPLTSNWFFAYGLIITTFNILTYVCFTYLFRSDSKIEACEEPAKPLGWSYAMTLGVVAGFSGLLIVFTRTIRNFQARVEFPKPDEYMHHLGTFNSYEGIASLMTLATLLFMSFCLKERLARGWRNFYFAIGAITMVLGGTFYFFNVFEDPIQFFITSKQNTTPLRSITMISAGYQILISSVAYPIVLSLKEIAIVPIKREIRFTAKLIIDLVFVKGFLVLGMLIFQSTLLLTGSFQASLPYITLIFFVICLSRFFIIARLGRSLESATLTKTS